jgi:ribosome-binding protein aMBF1 (putative translation factor)
VYGLSIFNWEVSMAAPETRFMPSVTRHIGYDPRLEAETLVEQFVRQRTTLGLSQENAAQELGVDAGTLARWERGEREPAGESLRRVERLLGDHDARRENVRRAG